MKKLLIASAITVSLFSQTTFASEIYASTPSEMSVISIIASPLVSSAAIAMPFAALSQASTPIRVNTVEPRANNKTAIKGTANDAPIEFEADTAMVKKANVKTNDKIMVKDAKLGYVLECNNVALGIVPNAQDAKNFKQEKLN
jgi:hypothetical protein